MAAPKLRYRLRVVGTKHDYIRRYAVVDSETGRRVDGVRGGLVKDDAQGYADRLNGVDPYAAEDDE